MEASQRRTEVLGPMRERMCKAVCARLDDKQAVQMALACAMREPEDLIGFLFSSNVAKLATKARDALAITPEEWEVIFGRDALPLRDAGVSKITTGAEFKSELASMSSALKCTVAEKEQSGQYARPWTQAVCYVGLHLEDADTAVEASLGTIVRADTRRLEDLRVSIDDTGVDTMLMAKIVMALSESIL